MLRAKKPVKRRKGISTLISSLYLILIGFLLTSTLFVSRFVSDSALIELITLEQERVQEKLLMVGPGAINLTTSSLVHSLKIINTGSIPIRLRALYINGVLVCDPSEFEGDAYIDPKDSLWVQLVPNLVFVNFNSTTMKASWTVATERGTLVSETGSNLLWGKSDVPIYVPNAFYLGPFMILFDTFMWRSGTGTWRSGWVIPKGTKDVTWRIIVVNIDTRDIVIDQESCLTLISNENSPKDPLSWYIDPARTSMILEPSIFNFFYYAWDKPVSKEGFKSKSVTGMQDLSTCISFLTFFGSFIEPNGTLTPFGQTIPFEAVLVTTESMADSVEVTTDPQNILNDGISTSTITGIVRDAYGKPVPGAWVDIYASAGILSTSQNQTDSDGVMTVTLTSSLLPTTAHVTTVCQGTIGICDVVFTAATNITVEADPGWVHKGATSPLTVQLINGNGVEVTQSGISITVEISAWTGATTKMPILQYGVESGESVTVTTDAYGRATLTMIAGSGTGNATVRATASGLNSGKTEVGVVD